MYVIIYHDDVPHVTSVRFDLDYAVGDSDIEQRLEAKLQQLYSEDKVVTQVLWRPV